MARASRGLLATIWHEWRGRGAGMSCSPRGRARKVLIWRGKLMRHRRLWLGCGGVSSAPARWWPGYTSLLYCPRSCWTDGLQRPYNVWGVGGQAARSGVGPVFNFSHRAEQSSIVPCVFRANRRARAPGAQIIQMWRGSRLGGRAKRTKERCEERTVGGGSFVAGTTKGMHNTRGHLFRPGQPAAEGWSNGCVRASLVR
eukprot:gene9848-biopygen16751